MRCALHLLAVCTRCLVFGVWFSVLGAGCWVLGEMCSAYRHAPPDPDDDVSFLILVDRGSLMGSMRMSVLLKARRRRRRRHRERLRLRRKR